MPRAPFTPAQTRDWQARMRVRLPDEKDLRLARRMELESDTPREATDYDKTVAGYLGELRRGEARALTWFLDHDKRLVALARVCGCRPEDFRSDLAAVEASELGPLDLLWWSGFEDLGPVALGEGFVLPPVSGEQGGRLNEEGLRKLLTDKAEIRVDGAPGAGVSTLLRWLATQAEAMGWRAVRWDGVMPTGRSLIVLADSDEGLEEAARRAGTPLADWLKAGDRRLLRRAPGGVRVGPVDLPWLREWTQRLAARAGRRLKLGGIGDRELEGLVGLGPEEAGLRVRDRIEPTRGGTAGILLAAAKRRLAALDHPADGLAHLDRWLPELYLRLLREPEGDATALLDETLLREVGRLVEALPLSGPDRDLLRSALPLVDGAAARLALRRARLLDERGGRSRLRLAGLIAPLAAPRIRDDPALLRRSLARRDGHALQAVLETVGGADAIVAALATLEAPGLRLALSEPPARWRAELPWTPSLLARWLALVELDGRGDEQREAMEKLDETWADAPMYRTTLMSGIRATLIAKATSPLHGLQGPLPDLDLLATAWAEVARELGLVEPPPERKQLRWLRAIHFAAAEDLRDPGVWGRTPDELLTPPGWSDAVRADPDVARAALSRAAGQSTRGHRALWVEAMASLCERAADEAGEILGRHLDDARVAFEAALDGLFVEDEDAQDGFGLRQTPQIRLSFAWSCLARELELLPRLLDRLRRPERLRPVLAAAAAAWKGTALREVPVFTEEPFAADQAGLLELLRTLSEDERAAWLRAPSGTPGPLAPVLARVGVPSDALIALFRELESGAVPWPATAPRRELGGEAEVDPQRPAWLRLLSATLPPERLAELGVEEATWAQLAGTSSLRGEGEDGEARRRWIWSLHHDLSPGDPIWGLVEGSPYKGTPWGFIEAMGAPGGAEATARQQPEAGPPSTFFGLVGGLLGEAIAAEFVNPKRRRVLELDRGHLERALRAGSGGAALGLDRWAALARAALLAEVAEDALWSLLDLELEPASKAGSKGPTPAATVAVLARRLSGVDDLRLRAWMSAHVSRYGALLDQPELVDRWADHAPGTLRKLLSAQPGEEVGAGLAHALLGRAPSEIVPLLADPRTRTATLQALSRDPGLRPALTPSLAQLGAPPSAAALQAVLRLEDPDPIELLGEASQGWSVEARRALWRQVAGLAVPVQRKRRDILRPPDRRLRARAWEKLAALEAAGVRG